MDTWREQLQRGANYQETARHALSVQYTGQRPFCGQRPPANNEINRDAERVIFNVNNDAIENYIPQGAAALEVVAINTNGVMLAVQQAAGDGIAVTAADAELPIGQQVAAITMAPVS